MQTFTLPRTGHRSLEFTGEFVAAASSKVEGWQGKQRWHEVTVYQASPRAEATPGEPGSAPTYVLRLAFRSEWPREAAWDQAIICNTVEDVEAALLQVDAGADVTGFPEGAQFERKKAREVERARGDWQRAVSEVLDRLAPPERV